MVSPCAVSVASGSAFGSACVGAVSSGSPAAASLSAFASAFAAIASAAFACSAAAFLAAFSAARIVSLRGMRTLKPPSTASISAAAVSFWAVLSPWRNMTITCGVAPPTTAMRLIVASSTDRAHVRPGPRSIGTRILPHFHAISSTSAIALRTIDRHVVPGIEHLGGRREHIGRGGLVRLRGRGNPRSRTHERRQGNGEQLSVHFDSPDTISTIRAP